MRDFLMTLNVPCSQDLHLLCHSLGNYVLQHALARIAQFTTGSILPRVFEHIFLCAADVDDDVLESGGAMERLHEMARSVDVYHNRGDVAMYISDYTKGHPERLGTNGSAHPLLLHNKVRQIDCTPVVKGEGLIEHDYYLVGHVNADIRQSIDGIPYDDERRRRVRSVSAPNVWTLRAS
jgi:esterase/lipase superfamily enzyme